MNEELQLILTEMRHGFKEINQKFEAIDQRFEAVDQKFDGMNERLDRIERKVDGIQKQVVKNSEAITNLNGKVDKQATILTTLSVRSIAHEGEIRNLKQAR
ncbi:hypothetical protein [Sporolactobacillus nakayamae]|uniref:t-SNARE coiled-coil homology domain-containing protein n=1 Tax=Sporolactobacillus nakayamae TaxID=269670 RepID=A0A1I2URC6_9BACL|nr:hypothetical protein [Sporolactobacillus nakayamae]SFG79623.1 hypothetical protein SAMN02982927_02804 [Sporolactobacillus nakayamae]